MFPSLNAPLHELEASEALWGWLFLVGAITAGVVIGILIPVISHHRSKVEARIEELKSDAAAAKASAEAQARHDELLADNTKLSKDLGEAREQIPKTSGVLIPGEGATPDIAEMIKGIEDEITAETHLIFLGDKILGLANEFPFALIKQEEEPMVVLDKQGERLLLSAKFFDKVGDILCDIENNRFRTNQNNVLFFEQDSPHHLAVVDKQRRTVLEIEYVNPRVIRIDGDFYLRRGARVVIDDEKLAFETARHIVALVEPFVFKSNDSGFAIGFGLQDPDGLVPSLTLTHGLNVREQSLVIQDKAIPGRKNILGSPPFSPSDAERFRAKMAFAIPVFVPLEPDQKFDLKWAILNGGRTPGVLKSKKLAIGFGSDVSPSKVVEDLQEVPDEGSPETIHESHGASYTFRATLDGRILKAIVDDMAQLWVAMRVEYLDLTGTLQNTQAVFAYNATKQVFEPHMPLTSPNGVNHDTAPMGASPPE